MLHASVAEGVHRIEDAYTNWYLVEEDGRLMVVDSGVPTSWSSFTDALRVLGHTPDDVEAIVLTHAHFDHVGFAERVHQRPPRGREARVDDRQPVAVLDQVPVDHPAPVGDAMHAPRHVALQHAFRYARSPGS